MHDNDQPISQPALDYAPPVTRTRWSDLDVAIRFVVDGSRILVGSVLLWYGTYAAATISKSPSGSVDAENRVVVIGAILVGLIFLTLGLLGLKRSLKRR